MGQWDGEGSRAGKLTAIESGSNDGEGRICGMWSSAAWRGIRLSWEGLRAGVVGNFLATNFLVESKFGGDGEGLGVRDRPDKLAEPKYSWCFPSAATSVGLSSKADEILESHIFSFLKQFSVKSVEWKWPRGKFFWVGNCFDSWEEQTLAEGWQGNGCTRWMLASFEDCNKSKYNNLSQLNHYLRLRRHRRHHRRHLFWKRSFFHAVRGLIVFLYVGPLYIPAHSEYCPFKLQTKQFHVIMQTFSPVFLTLLLHVTPVSSIFLHAGTKSSTLSRSDAQITLICNASPNPPHSEYQQDSTNPNVAFPSSNDNPYYIHISIIRSTLSRLSRFSAFIAHVSVPYPNPVRTQYQWFYHWYNALHALRMGDKYTFKL